MPAVSQSWLTPVQAFIEGTLAEGRILGDRQFLRDLSREAGLSRDFQEHVVDHLIARQNHWLDYLIAGGDPEAVPNDLEYLTIADLQAWLTEARLAELGLLEAVETGEIKAVTPELIRKIKRKVKRKNPEREHHHESPTEPHHIRSPDLRQH
jgi:hypothetical protein